MRTPGIGLLAATRAALAAWLFLGTQAAQASFLSGETMDKAADVIALIVLFIVPIIAIAVFWLVHILPEKIAEKREHPQKETIKVLCLLSLVFGGMLWPLAWILAYTKPVLFKMAYGREKHEDYYRHLAATDGAEARILGDDIARLRAEIDVLAARGKLPEELRAVREQLVALEAQLPAPAAKEGAG
jgi:CBS domain containing-hemolysin-like protein